MRKSKAAGYDFIKVTTFIKPEVYEAAVDEAANRTSAWSVTPTAVSSASNVESETADRAPRRVHGTTASCRCADEGSVSDLYIYNPENWKSFDYIDESKIPEIAQNRRINPYVDPTQHFMKNTFGRVRTEDEIRKQPDFRFYPPKVQQQWLDFYKKNRFINTVPLEKRARWIKLRDKLIKAIYDAGGRIMTGSDTPEFLWLYGFGMHHELKH